MNKYTLGAILLGAIILMAAYAYSLSGTGEPAIAQSVSAAITVTEDRHDFGTIDIFGGKVQTTYTLRNDGPDAVTITDAQTSCMCTEGDIAGYHFGMHGSDVKSVTIPAGEEGVVTATFDPLAHGPNGTGKITRELMLQTNSVNSPEVRLMFSGDVIKNETN